MDREYYTDVQEYSTNCEVQSNCNSITFINMNLTAVKVDTVILKGSPSPTEIGGSLSIDGNFGEKNITVYKLNFQGNYTGVIQVIRKFYK